MSDKTQEPPKWRKDFPIEWNADNYITRREFTKFLVMASGAMCVGSGYVAAQRLRHQGHKLPTVAVAAVGEIPIGTAKLFRYPTQDIPAVLIRLDENQYVAYLQRCTHLSCPITYNHEGRQLECPCHNGAFEAATGRVLGGPPPRPLPRIALRIENGTILAHDLEEDA
jgi:Rieske Fe-S protein